MKLPTFSVAALVAFTAAAIPELSVQIAARTGEIESDWTTVYYGVGEPLLVGNDGGAASGGLHFFGLGEALPEKVHQTPGRTKLVTTVYGVANRDLVVTIAQTDSFFRAYDATTGVLFGEPMGLVLGDWSALCGWRSQESGLQYLFLFGKGQARQFLVRESSGSAGLLEIQSFKTAVEASACAVSPSSGVVYFSSDDSQAIHGFEAAESVSPPQINIRGQVENPVTGLGVYVGGRNTTDYLLVAQEDVISIHGSSLRTLGNLKLAGDEDIEVQGLSIYQGPTAEYAGGIIAYAVESDVGAGFGISSLGPAFAELGLRLNPAYDPREAPDDPVDTVCAECNQGGFCALTGQSSCSCFTGFEGSQCQGVSCRGECSGHGQCTGPNQCQCNAGWGGLDCAFRVVRPVAETEAIGGDGDDPAIWLSSINAAASRIVTTTKSEEDAGLNVFDLQGKLLQTMAAGEPNNVDVIYAFVAGNRTVDLVYAACRADNTLWYVLVFC